MQCSSCGSNPPAGSVHVPGRARPGRKPRCKTVTKAQLERYLAAHCTNCGSALDDREHFPVAPGSCSVGQPLGDAVDVVEPAVLDQGD